VGELRAEQARLQGELEAQAALVRQLQSGPRGSSPGESLFVVSSHLLPREVNAIPSRLNTPMEAEWVGGPQRQQQKDLRVPPLYRVGGGGRGSGRTVAWPAIAEGDEDGYDDGYVHAPATVRGGGGGGGNGVRSSVRSSRGGTLNPSGERSYYDEMPPEEQQFLDMLDQQLVQAPDGGAPCTASRTRRRTDRARRLARPGR
jgi:hypothetical protein